MKWIVLLLIFLVGCSSTPIGPHEGKKGLDITFASYSQREAYVSSTLSVGVEMTNYGAENIDNGILVVSAPRSEFEEFEGEFPISLVGKVETLSHIGEEDVRTIEIKTKPLFAAEEKNVDIVATACYRYTTIFSAPVCIDTDYLNLNPNKPRECPPRETTYSRGQGAPVNVIRVTPQMIPSNEGEFVTPIFKIEVAKTQEGDVVDKNKIEEACSAFGSAKGSDLIDTSRIMLGSEVLSCDKAQVSIRQEDSDWYETAIITCTGEKVPVSQQPYIGRLTATLDYGFRNSITLPVTVKRP